MASLNALHMSLEKCRHHLFLELLFERMTERVTETIELEGEVVDNQLVLRLPVELETAVYVQGNEILIGDRRIIVKLKNGPIYPTAH